MLEAFRVGASLSLQSNAAKVLTEIGESFLKFDKHVEKAAKSVKALQESLNGLKSITRELETAANAAQRLAGAGRNNTHGGSSLTDAQQRMKLEAQAVAQQQRLALQKSQFEERMAAQQIASQQRLTSQREAAERSHIVSLEKTAQVQAAIDRRHQMATQAAEARRVANQSSMLARQQAMTEAAEARRASNEAAAAARQQTSLSATAARQQASAEAAEARRSASQSAANARQQSRFERADAAKAEREAARKQRLGTVDYAGAGMVANQWAQTGQQVLGRSLNYGIDAAHTEWVIGNDDRVSKEDMARIKKAGWDITKSAPGTTYGQNLEAISDLKNVTGDVHEALEIAPQFSKLAAFLATLDKHAANGHGGNPAFAAAKALEILGGMTEAGPDGKLHLNPHLLTERIEKIARVAMATNGRVMPNDYLKFAKQARVGGMLLNDEFLYERLPAMMMIMGGDKAGTAMQSLSQVFVGGKMTEKSYQQLADMGLAKAPTRVKGRDGKMHTRFSTDDVFESKTLMHDPVEWMKKVDQHLIGRGMTDIEERLKFIQRFAQRGTIAGFLGDALKDLPNILKEQESIQHQRKDTIDASLINDPAAKMNQFHAALTNLLTVLGGELMVAAIPLIEKLTSGLNAVGQFAAEHPTLGTVLTSIAAGLVVLAGAAAFASGALLLANVGKAGAGGLLGRLFGNAAPALARAAPSVVPAAATSGILGAIGRFLIGGGTGLAAAALGYGVYKGATMSPAEQIQAGKDIEEERKGTRRAADSAMQTTHDGFDASGRPVTPVAPPLSATNTTVNLSGNVTIDGKKIGEIVANSIATLMNRPSAGGSSNISVRAGPLLPGLVTAQ